MPIKDIEAMNQSLANDYGTSPTDRPTSHECALFAGDPMDDGVEVSGGGYARVTILDSDWDVPADGAISTTDPVQFPDTTDEYSDTVTHVALIADDVVWDCFALAEPLEITGPGAGPLVQVEIFHADAIAVDEENF